MNKEREMQMDLSFLPKDKKIRIITDGKEKGRFIVKDEDITNQLSISVKAYGGFVITTEGVHTHQLAPEKSSMKMNAYPNPSNTGETISVKLDIGQELLNKATIEIYDLCGISLKKIQATGLTTSIAMPLQAGTYILKARADSFVDEKLLIVK